MKVNLLWCPQRHKKILELSNLSSLRFWRNKGRQAVTATQKKKKKMDEILCRKTKLLEMIVDLILTMYHRDQSENPNIFIYDKLNKNRLFICICALKCCFVKALHLRQPLRYRTLPDWIVIIPTGYDTLNSFCHETRTYQETITITTA